MQQPKEKILAMFNSKEKIIIATLIAVIIIGTAWGILKYKNRNNPENKEQVYEALVNIVDQKASDPVEDARSSLKKGDVTAYFPEGHSWSDTEKNSYLIVKLKLKPADAAKLMEAVTKETPLSPPLDKGGSEGGSAPFQGGNERGPEGPRPPAGGETVRARQYFLNLPSFDVQKFWETQTQPFGDKIFGSGIIKKK
jgi:hypothetical protein